MIRTLRSILAASMLVAAIGLQAQQAAPPQKNPPASKPEQKPDDKKAPLSIAGKWAMTLEMAMGNGTPSLELKQDGEKLTGTYTGRYGAAPIVGTLRDHSIEFKVNIVAEGTEVEMLFTGEVTSDGASMRGDASLGPAGDATWLARKQKSQAAP
jgi:hypothetical protein